MITELMECQRDFDWFLTGINDEIIHLTSGGGRLPNLAKKSLEDLEFLLYYFESLPVTNETEKYNKFGYESYASMSQRGIFTFERSDLSNGDGTIYKKVYQPNKGINIKEQPEEIQGILAGLSIDVDPSIETFIDIQKLL